MKHISYSFALVLMASYFISHGAYASSLDSFLEGPAFDHLCEATVKILGSDRKTSMTQLSRPEFVESADHLYVALRTKASRYEVRQIEKSEPENSLVVLETRTKIRDLSFYDEMLWVLLSHELVAYNGQSFEPVFRVRLSNEKDESAKSRAYQMIWTEKGLLIAYGADGLKLVDPDQQEVVAQYDLGLHSDGGQRSSAIALASWGQVVVVGVTNLTLPVRGSSALNGLIFFEPETEAERYYPFHKASSGVLTPVVSFHLQKDRLWINNWGTLQYLDLTEVEREEEVRASHFLTRQTVEGVSLVVEPLGEFFIQNERIYACVHARTGSPGRPPVGLGLAYRHSL